ncbi:MAG TPA: YXWGXW repeat-containing protein [Polyangiaceae bacterium]|nr:YXWGXW repeat-containing protein [Polyangiaceae bacterium]
MRRSALAIGCAIASTACGAAIPEPPRAPQPPNAFVEVPYPPPPARVEQLPGRPDPRAVWTDGQWTWDGTRWAWTPGGWVIAPAAGQFARWALRLTPDGRLQFAPASWRDAAGRELPPARVVASAIGEATNRTLPARCP